jgi:chromosome partitioning protein
MRLTIASNAGGSGKTTTAVHLGYAIARKGYRVTIIELDCNGSLGTFAGLPLEVNFEESVASILQPSFQGRYPLKPVWQTELKNKLFAIQGGTPLEKSIKEVHTDDRGFYALADRLEDYPLDADLIIFDVPASLEPMATLALIASTHVLCPIKPEQKDVDCVAKFIEWHHGKIKSFRLRPEPEILGFLPIRVDPSIATHRDILGIDEKGKSKQSQDSLPYIIEQDLGYQCFSPIKDSNYYLSAAAVGLPVPLFRSGCKAAKDFEPIAKTITQLIENK